MHKTEAKMEICEKNKCTGCTACANACPVGCITMQCDEYGELHPVVDSNSCISCNACIRSCPNNYSLTFRKPQQCHASWTTDTQKRKRCASGGIGTLMSEYVISHHKGVVYGTRFDDSLTPITTAAETLAELEAFKGSKYVQSKVGESYKNIKKHLLERRMVLYIATPCQIAGLTAYLKKDYDNLITVDLICHGVNPSSYLEDEIAYLKTKKRLSAITNCRFRSNDDNDFHLTLWSDKRRIYKARAYHQPYFCGFMLGVTLRENCYSCNYARPERVADITIGDFLGLGKQKPFEHKVKNASSVFLNSDRGVDFYTEVIAANPSCISVERELAERLAYKPSLLHPFRKHELAPIFRANYLEHGFVKAARLTMHKIIRMKKIKYIISLPERAIRTSFRGIKGYFINL